MTTPVVSICCITYNHENYIRQCLDGFVMQQTNFPFEILVHDDASTDGNAAIIREYEAKYPHLFRCVYQTVNQFAIQNTLTNILFPMAKGKYIALCEGDDYWTDPLKLQKQVDFLEWNSEYALCFHSIQILEPDGCLREDYITHVPEKYEDIETLARLGNYIHTPSVVFRNIITIFPPEFKESPLGDYFLYMLLGEQGKLKKLDDIMAVYRHGVGVWSTNGNDFRYNKTAITFLLLARYFKPRNSEVFKIFVNRVNLYLNHSWHLLSEQELSEFMKFKEISPLILKYRIDKLTQKVELQNKENLYLKNDHINCLEKFSTIKLIFELGKRIKRKVFSIC